MIVFEKYMSHQSEKNFQKLHQEILLLRQRGNIFQFAQNLQPFTMSTQSSLIITCLHHEDRDRQ